MTEQRNGNGRLDGGIDRDLLGVMLQYKVHCEKPIRIVSVEQVNAIPEGQNFASSIHRVQVKCILASGRYKTYSLIVKVELINLRALTGNHSSYFLFRQETHAYTRVIADMNLLMEEFHDRRDTLWAEFYGFVPYHTIVLEDLTEKEYVTVNRKEMLDMDHVKLIMRSLGRFHAMTLVLRSKGMINEDDRGKNTIASNNRVMEKLYESGLIVLSSAIDEVYGEGWKEVAVKLRAQIPKLFDKMKELSTVYDQKYEVLNHGDMWNCNIMFKHMEYTKIPVSLKFVDFQVMHLNSFIWDITHVLNTCMFPKILRENRELLLSTYQESLERNLKFYAYKGYIPSLEDVISESRRLLYAEFALRVIVRPVITYSLPEAWDLKMLINKEPHEALNKTCYTDETVVDGIKDDLLWFQEQEVF